MKDLHMFGERIGRIALLALGGGALYLLLSGIGWAAVCFWKSEAIVWCAFIPSLILCPAQAISVVPGSSLDTPVFFVPMMSACFILWAIFIEALWRRRRPTSGTG